MMLSHLGIDRSGYMSEFTIDTDESSFASIGGKDMDREKSDRAPLLR